MSRARILSSTAIIAAAILIGVWLTQVGGIPAETMTPAAAGPAQEHDEGSAGGDVIAVHGHWTVDVLEADGTLASRHEFTNAYVGGANLARFLSRDRVVGTWIVEITSNALCNNTSGAQTNCEIHESHTPFSGPNIFPNLTISVPTSGDNQNKLVLSGTATAARSGQVASVGTKIRTCAGNVAPSSCTGAAGVSTFTARTIPSADRPSVSAGQQVAVTVVIGFN